MLETFKIFFKTKNIIEKTPLCEESPCENDGNCIDLPKFEYECECKEFFAGVNCTEGKHRSL